MTNSRPIRASQAELIVGRDQEPERPPFASKAKVAAMVRPHIEAMFALESTHEQRSRNAELTRIVGLLRAFASAPAGPPAGAWSPRAWAHCSAVLAQRLEAEGRLDRPHRGEQGAYGQGFERAAATRARASRSRSRARGRNG